jgi:hypothetical protein
MQCNTTFLAGKEKRIGICWDSNSEHGSERLASALQKLLDASRDAEVLIACIFELHLITAAPLLDIWNRLAAAINETQSTLQAEHLDRPQA